MSSKNIKGSCLCGEVTYHYSGNVKVFQYCHCSRCKKFTGSAHASNIIISPDDFKWLNGEDFLGRYELPNAKHFATCFCKKCGSSLPWLSQSGQAVIIPAGTLDDEPDAKPQHNIFCEEMASWYVDVDRLKKYKKLPVS